MRSAQRIVRQYERGDCTKTELFLNLMAGVTDRNAVRFDSSMSPELLVESEEYVNSCPQTEANWRSPAWQLCKETGWGRCQNGNRRGCEWAADRWQTGEVAGCF